jgi:hypothetical protein
MRRQIIALSTALTTLAFVSATLIALGQVSSKQANSPPGNRQEFAGWPKPDVVLLISGQQYGYIEPCGCTGLTNQKGGLVRRDTLFQTLQQRGWTLVPLDAGNQVRRIGAQAGIKFQFTINTLRQINYRAVGLGPDDLRLEVGELLAAVTSSLDAHGQSDLFVCANANPAGFVGTHRVIEAGGLRIGVTAVLGEESRSKVTQAEIETRPAEEALREAIAELKAQQCNFTVCLAQADDQECHRLAKAVPGIDLIVAAAGAGEPRYQPEPIPDTQTALIQAGSKGMYIGAIGLFKGQKPLVRYQRIALDARFNDSQRMLEMFAEYQATLQEQGLAGLGLKPVQHLRGKFTGSQACGECHTRAYAKWLETPHHDATDSIAHPTERSNIPRHHDPECLSCHVTGWNPQAYFPYAGGYIDLDTSASLHGNGCENCHGPGQAHVDAENGTGDVSDDDIQRLRKQMRLELSKAEQHCMECHDLDNSPDFHHADAFQKYWEQIKHPWPD